MISKCILDLGLVVDRTKSIKTENIPKVKAALEHLVQKFDVSTGGTHISFETFAKKAKLHNKFKDEAYHNQTAVLNLIEGSFTTLRQPTRLDKAIKLAKAQMFTEQRGLRQGVGKVLVLYTDGRSHPSNTESFYLDVAQLKVRPVAIGEIGVST